MGKPRKPTEFPETATAAEIAGFVGLSERRVYQLSQDGTVPLPVGPNSYPFRASVLAIVERERRAATGDDAQRNKDKARRDRAEADTAELNAGELSKALVRRADVRRVLSDFMVKLREAIQRSPLHDKHKSELTEAVAKIKIAEIEP